MLSASVFRSSRTIWCAFVNHQKPPLASLTPALSSSDTRCLTYSTSSTPAAGVSASSTFPSTAATGRASSPPSASAPNPVLHRYLQLVEEGSLQRDDQQMALVEQLSRLYDEICSYRARMDEYHRATEAHEARRLARLQELLAEEQRQREREAREAEERRQRGEADAGSSAVAAENGAWRSWVKSAWAPLANVIASAGWAGGADGGGSGTSSSTSSADSPAARERQAAARREERLLQELGPPPAAPEPPKGIYVWGSVGSGKSMLMTLFYQALVDTAQLPASRWMHFNAAMLEIHSRLHHLDVERWRLRDERDRLHHQHRLNAAASAAVAGGQAAADVAAAKAEGVAGSGVEGDDSDEDDGDEGDETLPVPAERQGVFAHWDPRRDPEVQRQREAKAAMLAVRRHMRLARLGRKDPQTLAAANAQGLVRAAASFIRGRSGDPLSGWSHSGSGPIASVLYFDEVQVTDVFSAVALKGLVEALTSAGCVLVATSNRAPHELPRHGLHEDMWQHFVDTLLQRCAVHELSSPADYRRVLLEQGRASIAAAGANTGASSASSGASSGTVASCCWPPLQRSYLHPAGPESTSELERMWRARSGGGWGAGSRRQQLGEPGGGGGAGAGELAGPEAEERLELVIPVLFGRWLEVRRSSPCGGAAWFRFEELCGRPLGPADYVALSQRFHTVFLQDIPAMSMQVRDQARRFITLVDELYNARCLLVASAQVPPEELFQGAEGEEPILDLEGLQFETAVEGARLRRDATAAGGVAPVLSSGSPGALAAAAGALGGAEERFAFRRAVSRLLEMQSPQYIQAAIRMRQ